MGGVDKFDQRNKTGGGFASKARFKKWYKKRHLGLKDYMLANGQVDWNMTAADPQFHHASVTPWHCNAGVAEEMIAYKDDNPDDETSLQHMYQ